VTADKATERFPNLTIKKIPKMVLERCEWGHDDYSLNIANLPIAEPDINIQEEKPKKTKKSPAKKQAKPTAQQNGLFDDDPSESEQQGSESEQQGGQP
jgi:adenine-specific DNA-methyltransferase